MSIAQPSPRADRPTLHRRVRRLVLTALFAMSVTAGSAPAAQRLDVLITNGTVYDGSGAPPVVGDVGIANGRIVFVGSRKGVKADSTIDATGLAVAPGFIDPHNHMPDAVEAAPTPFLDEAFILQGVTTVVFGADGFLGPEELRRKIALLRSKASGTNFGCYVGHNGIRKAVMGHAQRAPTAAELEEMKTLVRDGMRMGCVGLSSGLMYDPGMFSKPDELVALAKEVKPFDGTYDSHTRFPVAEMVASEKEALETGMAAGIPPKLAHLKAVGRVNAGRIGEVIALVEQVRASGVQAVADQYPYDGAAVAPLQTIFVFEETGKITLPLAEAQAKVRAAIASPKGRAALRNATLNGLSGGFSWVKAVGFGSMRIVDAPADPALVGQNLEAQAIAEKRDPFDLAADMLLSQPDEVLVTLGSIEENDIETLMVQPWVMIASDGLPTAGGYAAHPRTSGTFPRVLGHYSRDRKLFSLSEAIRKMTSFPADHLRFYDRGRLLPGKVADVTIFDPATVIDRATYRQPELPPTGIVHVLVNGRPVVKDGRVTGRAPGKFVKRQSPRRVAR